MGAILEHIRATVDRMADEAETSRQRERRERWRTAIQATAAFGAAFSGGAAALALVLHWMGKL